jgi:hypothetical protein
VGYQLQAVIASAELLRRLTAGQTGMHVVELNQDFALMPMTGELYDRVVVLGGERYGFWFLPAGFGDTLAAWSVRGPVVYAEAEFFGGIGMQRAAVWDNGRLAFGPLYNGEDERFAPEGSPISQALRYMGADRDRCFDEFDAVGLNRHRHIEGWLARSRPWAGRPAPACVSTSPIGGWSFAWAAGASPPWESVA